MVLYFFTYLDILIYLCFYRFPGHAENQSMELFEYASVSEFPVNIHLIALDSSELDLFVVFGEGRVTIINNNVLVILIPFIVICIFIFILLRSLLPSKNSTGVSKIKVTLIHYNIC